MNWISLKLFGWLSLITYAERKQKFETTKAIVAYSEYGKEAAILVELRTKVFQYQRLDLRNKQSHYKTQIIVSDYDVKSRTTIKIPDKKNATYSFSLLPWDLFCSVLIDLVIKTYFPWKKFHAVFSWMFDKK